ncbi:MAG: hypothetical protein SAK29_42295, partial [Scytonema sp. PMC 1069.18]|nr:hypothetical protein [Scytonema sp. PMC 1069.18]
PMPEIFIEEIETIQSSSSLNWNKLAEDLKKKIGLKLTSPLSKQSKEQENFFTTLLRGGVPIAFWTRYQTPSHLTIERINCYLTVECLNNNLKKLVEQMCEIRKQAYIADKPKECLGYHLGFLCDNPNRMPRIKQLKGF